ncbi:hypothetical protein Tco_1075375 [Tanacetum coccineum]
MMYVVDGVLVRGVDMILEMDFVCFAIQETEIHSLMIQIRILSMFLKIFPTTLHNPSTRRILVHAQPEDIQELLHKLLKDLQIIREELAEYIKSPSWNLPTSSYDDDDDEYSFATQEYIMTCSTAITPDSPKTDSLIMVDKHLDTILEMESDEFIKSSVENLVQNPRESEDECECDVPDCDDSQTTNFSTFSNPLFDDSTSSDDKSSHEEVIHEISFKTYSNPLFDLDEEIISKVYAIQIRSSCSLPTFPIHVKDSDSLMEEIDLFLDSDDSIPPDRYGCFDMRYWEDISEHYVLMPKLLPTRPTLYPDIDTLLPFSSENKDKVFNPGILSSPLLSHWGKFTSDFSESPMMIFGGNIPLLDVPIAPDYEDSRARGFVHRPLDLQSLACLYRNPISVTDIAQKDKNKAKRTKPSTELEKHEKTKAEGVAIFYKPTRAHLVGRVIPSNYLLSRPSRSSPMTPLTLPMPRWQSQRIPLVDWTCKVINGQDQRRGGQTKNEWLGLEVGECL